LGRYGAAEAEYAAVLDENPKEFSALIGAAATYLQEYRLQPAAEMIHRALELKPSDPEANYIAGEVFVDQRRFDEAESHLIVGLQAKAELIPRIHALLGQVYANKGDNTQAIEELKQGLPSDDDGSIHFQLGRLYQKTGQTKLAEAAFEETRRLQSRR
jgi:tetratricopeptide (TPR) repeat protein